MKKVDHINVFRDPENNLGKSSPCSSTSSFRFYLHILLRMTMEILEIFICYIFLLRKWMGFLFLTTISLFSLFFRYLVCHFNFHFSFHSYLHKLSSKYQIRIRKVKFSFLLPVTYPAVNHMVLVSVSLLTHCLILFALKKTIFTSCGIFPSQTKYLNLWLNNLRFHVCPTMRKNPLPSIKRYL